MLTSSPVPAPPVGPDAVPIDAVVLGASAGAIEVLGTILPSLEAGYPVPVVVVVHVPPDVPSLLVELFAPRCALAVKEVQDKEPLVPGTIYFAPPDYHVLVEGNGHLSLSADPPVNFSRPSIDVLFESAADAYGPGLLGVVFTGASSDGARGLAAIRQAGGRTLVQDPSTAYATAMPTAAIAIAKPDAVLSIAQIAEALRDVGRGAREKNP